MDSKITSELKNISDKLYKFESRIDQLERKIDEIYRELGTRDGNDLYRQINDLRRKDESNEKLLYQITADISAVRKSLSIDDVDIKSIKDALTLIYRNTDELEEHLLGSERNSK